jgi:hypothetical protein
MLRRYMNRRPDAWEKYRVELRQFDAVLDHARAVSAALVGRDAPSTNATYAEQIFVKALSHCLVMRQLAPDPKRQTPNELWDVPSISSIGRCVIDSHDAFTYICAFGCSQAEASFRVNLWEAHDKTRRIRMLKAIGSADARLDVMLMEANEGQAKLQAHPVFATLRSELKQKINAGDPPPYHLSKKEICAAAGVDYEYYTAVTMQLSQYVHAYPFAVRQMFHFRAGEPDSLGLMALPLQFTLPFLGRLTDGMRALFPRLTPEAPSRTAKTMAKWRLLSATGLKTAS